MKKKLKKKIKKSASKKKGHSKKKFKENKEIQDSKEKMKEIVSDVIERAKAMAPMTKEEWEKRQSIVRRIYDEETGRHR